MPSTDSALFINLTAEKVSFRQNHTRSSPGDKKLEHNRGCLDEHITTAEIKRVHLMVSLEKAILFNIQGILLLGTPRNFTFNRKDMFKELPCLSVNYS